MEQFRCREPKVASDSKKDSEQELDRLLSEAKNLQQRSKALADDLKESAVVSQAVETLKSVQSDLGFLRRTILNIKELFMALYEHVLIPIWSFIGGPVMFAVRLYRRIWNRLAFATDKKTGERILSRRRAGVLLTITFLIVAMFTPTRIGDTVRFVTIEPIIDGFLMATSLRTETFYLNNSEEIDPERNIHSVRGCRREGSCVEKEAVYFRVRPRLSHDIWKLVNYSNPFYVPDHVVAPIAPGVNRCSVAYYGYRMTSSWIARLLRSMQFYPTMLEASCHYIGSEDIKSSTEENNINNENN